MAEEALAAPLRRLLHLAASQGLGGLPDGELLGRFAASRNEAAFAALVERHGPLVFAVCRRALASRHDAEDACQATFLVLARKAASLRKGSCLGAWLHGVALRVAARLKRDAARRGARERSAGLPRTTDPAEEATWREVRAALDEELALLPQRYRDPLVLCYLECLTRDEAAARLGLSPGALHGRLERGRLLLRQRLTKRGLALSCALLAALSQEARAQLPPLLAVTSTRAATLFAAGEPLVEGAVSGNVLALTNEVFGSMSMSKLKLCAAAVLVVAVLATFGAGALLPTGQAQDPKPAPLGLPAKEKAEADEDYIRRMSKELRGTDPTPAEVHFFAASKEAQKKEKLLDLFIEERQARKRLKDVEADEAARLKARRAAKQPADLEGLQQDFYKKLQAATGKAEVATITRGHLDLLLEFVKKHPDGKDAPAAMRTIASLYEALGKADEAGAWRDKLAEPGKADATPDVPGNSPYQRH